MKQDETASCRYFTAEDACRLALQAYYGAGKDMSPPAGETWMDESGEPWAGPTDFLGAFIAHLEARLAMLALDQCGEFLVCGAGDWDLFKLATRINPERTADINAVWSGMTMKELHPSDNYLHNDAMGEAHYVD